MEGHKFKGGKKLLQLCMGQNYYDSNVVYREYVQNACDSLYAAQRMGLIKNLQNSEVISVEINRYAHEVVVLDRGTGVPFDKIGDTLVDIGASTKNGYDDIGNYGIGRLVGANWCDKIVFETSYVNENIKSILTFDAKAARKFIESDTDYEIGEIVDSVTQLVKEHENETEHYFRVRLINAKDELLDFDKVYEYLAITAPVPYQYIFDEMMLEGLDICPDFKPLLDAEKVCVISLKQGDSSKEIEKPYTPKIDVAGTQADITPPTFFEISDHDFGQLAWGWYSLKTPAEQMNSVHFRGIRLRKHNMAVGNEETLAAYFPKPVDANYFVGEVFITHRNIIPAGSRNGLCQSTEKEVFDNLLKNKFKELKKTYDTLSRIGSAALKPYIDSEIILKQAKSILVNEPDSDVAKQTKVKAQADIKKYKSELAKKLKDVAQNTEVSPLVDQTVKYWQKEADKKVSDKNASKKPEEKIDQINIRGMVNKVMDELEEATSPNAAVTNQPSTPTGSSIISSTPNTQESKETDVYRGLGKSEWQIMKKVYSVLNADKKLDPISLERIKKKLKKKLLDNNE